VLQRSSILAVVSKLSAAMSSCLWRVSILEEYGRAARAGQGIISHPAGSTNQDRLLPAAICRRAFIATTSMVHLPRLPEARRPVVIRSRVFRRGQSLGLTAALRVALYNL
jgi:hypothetical protein